MKPRIRCSSLNQVIECPGSRTLNAIVAEILSEGSVTWAGNWCHWEAARQLIATWGAVTPVPLPARANVPADFKPTDFDRWVVSYYINEVLERVGEEMALEVEGSMEHDIGPCILTGHPDLLAISGDGLRGVGADLKRGFNIVDEAGNNWQVAGYMGLEVLEFPTLQSLEYVVVQPAIPVAVGDRETETKLEGDDLRRLPALLAAKIAESLASPMLLNSGWKQCAYCPAALQCPCLIEELEAMKLTLSPEALAKIRETPDDATLARWTIAFKAMNPVMEKARDLLRDRVAAAGTIVVDGIPITTKPHNGERKMDPAKSWDRIVDLFDEATAYSCMTISATATEKALAKKFNIPQKSQSNHDARAEFRNRFADVTTQEVSRQLVIG